MTNGINMELMVQSLTSQIAQLSKDKAVFFALATEREQIIQQLNVEIENLKLEKNE